MLTVKNKVQQKVHLQQSSPEVAIGSARKKVDPIFYEFELWFREAFHWFIEDVICPPRPFLAPPKPVVSPTYSTAHDTTTYVAAK